MDEDREHDTHIFGAVKTPDGETMLIIAAAVQGGARVDWAAYLGLVYTVEGWENAWKDGTKLDYNIARMLFPEFDQRYRWRP